MIRVDVLTDPRLFVEQAQGFLDSEPLVDNIVASMAERRTAEPESDASATVGDLWFVIRDGAEIVGAGMATDGFPPYLLAMSDDAAVAVADALAARTDQLSGVNGEISAATAFAAAWARRHGLAYRTDRRNRLFRLADLLEPAGVSGRLLQARPGDVDLIHRWTAAFHTEATGGERVPAREASLAKIERGLAWLWLDDVEGVEQPVSYTGGAVPVRGVHRIGPVYTPPQFRRHGYASACVARVSHLKRAAGASEVCLFTDQANPTANKVYQAIGFVPVADTVNLGFVAGPRLGG
jgi:GNAT superfamily N-acetyltransferase